MAILESQLETWSHQGADTTSKNTYASIKKTLTADYAPYSDKTFEVFLQGSYGNDTYIRADSDVDIVIMLTSLFRADISQLPLDQANAYHRAFSDSTYQFSEFKNGVIEQLRSTYGSGTVQVANKSTKILRTSSRLGADVIICHQYRYYNSFFGESNQSYDEGIVIPTSWGKEIINYPKLHSQNLTAKHQNTDSIFKPMVRILKNIRGRLVADGIIDETLAFSYFIEGLLFNVPDEQFMKNFGDTFCNCVNWLLKTDRSQFVCPNWKEWLFGDSSVQWNKNDCESFLNAAVNLWNGW